MENSIAGGTKGGLFLMSIPGYMRSEPDGVLVSIKLQPRASRNQICAPLGQELRIKVTAPPVDSAANEALVEFISCLLDCAKGRVQLIRGHTSRHKTVKLLGFTSEQVLAKIGTTS